MSRKKSGEGILWALLCMLLLPFAVLSELAKPKPSRRRRRRR